MPESMSTKALVILREGKGDHAAVKATLRREFKAAGISYEIREAKKKKQAEKIARRHAKEFDLVIAGGGDGTVSRVSSGLRGTSIPLAIIPMGTGNMVARELGIPVDIDKAVALITGEYRKKKIDAMKIGKHLYVLNAGIGINAQVVARTNKKNKRLLGRLAYVTNIMQILRFRPRSVDIKLDGKEHHYRAVDVAVSNCGAVAKAVYPPGPEIRPDDGRIDVWVLGMESALDYARYLVGILFGRRRKARYLSARESVEISSPFPLAAQADGNIIGTTPLHVEVRRKALTIIVPPAQPA
jgi:YegS/Rv2252/BmrU family lipid kinase